MVFGGKRKDESQENENVVVEHPFGKVETIIGNGTTINGVVEVIGILRIDGKLEGELKSQGDVIVGESGNVASAIAAKNVTVAGRVSGNIEATGRLDILPTGKVLGDIRVGQLAISDGATFQGKCEMIKQPSEPDNK